MENTGSELRKLRQVLWVLAALWAVQIGLEYGPRWRSDQAHAGEPSDPIQVDIVRVSGHKIVGRQVPVEVAD